MKGKITRAVLSVALASSITLGNLGGVVAMAQNDNGLSSSTIDELLQNLPENSKNYLEVSSGSKIKLDKSVDLKSSDTVKIIVEFNKEPVAVQNSLKNTRKVKLTEEDLLTEHEEFKNSLGSGSSTYNADSKEVKIEFGYEYVQVFNGIAMTVPANEVEKIAEMDMVKTIWSNEEFQLELPEDDEISYFTTDGVTPFMHDSLPGIGVDKLHEEGIKGAGIKVGVLDTGVDYNHPDLKDAYKGGYDFIDNDEDPMETTYEDWKESGMPEFSYNGSEYYTAHGTHVSGTILGRGTNPDLDSAIIGVAPEADLYAYRVLGPYGSGSNEGILAGIDKAVKDGMDVINLSLGTADNDALSPDSIAINNCMLYTDTVAVIAAGNSGPGPYTVGSPATSALGIAVGANNSEISLDTIEMLYMDESYSLMSFAKNWKDKIEDLLSMSLSIEFAGLGSEEEFAAKDFSGKIALVERGEITFVDKIANAKAAGATCVIIYNNVEGDIGIYLGEDSSYITTLSMSKEIGEKLKEAVVSQNESEEVVTFQNVGEIREEGNSLVDFSSRGPVSANYDIKPEVTAPGYNILSTVPGYMNSKDGELDYANAYLRMSGTSMAAPHVAGVVALILENNSNYKPKDVKTVLMNTTEELNGDYSVYEVGAGRINAYEAVKSEVNIQVDDTTESINDAGETTKIPDITGDFSFRRGEKGVTSERNFTITNNSSEEKNFTVETYFSNSKLTSIENPEQQGIVIGIPSSIKVNSGEEVQSKFEINIPEEAASGIYEGYVILTNTDNLQEDYRLPFAINVSDTYINVDALINIFSLGEFHPYKSVPYIYLGCEISDKVKNVDVLIKDGETDEYIGYVGSLIMENVPTNSYFEVGPLIGYGYYCPILKDYNGKYYIDYSSTKLSEDKRYIVEFRGVTDDDEVIIGSDDYFVDSKPPVMIMDEDSKPGIYEVEYDENNPEDVIWLNGRIYDEYVEYAKSYGYEISQQDNMIFYLESINGGHGQGRLGVGENGELTIGYTKKEISESGVARISIYPMDKAFCGDYRRGLESYAFIKKGMPYIAMAGENRSLNIGDTITMPMTGKYLTDFAFGSFDAIVPTLESGEEVYRVKSVKPTKELEKFLSDNNMEINIEIGEKQVGFGEASYPIKCELKGTNIVGINGDMNLLDFEVEVVNISPEAMAQIVKVGTLGDYMSTDNFNYINTKGELENIEVLNVSKGVINIDKANAVGEILPQGASDEYYNMLQSLKDMGTKVTVTTPKGGIYNALLDYEGDGSYKIQDIPVEKGNYTVTVETPGHLSVTRQVRLSFEYGDELYGGNIRMFKQKQYGGDVNGDGVIDIRDALIIARAIGNKVQEVQGICRDINNDGIVDETDLNYVVENFEMMNGMQENVDIVLYEYDGMTLEDVVAKAGTMKDEVGPEITINVEDGKVYNSQVNLEVVSTDYIYSTHKVYVNGELFEGSSLYEDGKYEIKVVAMDDLGNTSEKTVNIGIKTEGPKVVIEGVEDGKTYDGPVKPVITLEEETENTVTLNNLPYDGKEISEEGKYTLKVVSKDIAGNVTEVTVNFEIVKKAVTPEPGNTDNENNNKPGNNLPQTGAIVGSTLLGLVGIAIIGAGVFGVVTMKKKRIEENESKEK